MEEINNIEVVPCTESDYLKPFRVHYNQVTTSGLMGISQKRSLVCNCTWTLDRKPCIGYMILLFPFSLLCLVDKINMCRSTGLCFVYIYKQPIVYRLWKWAH
uniref:Uncharacterized protein n=1 Tax=Labrus bergylta TaxID=56723 RepID=A0A3Q3EW65_9LABR